jgi:ABC-type phosphate transport system auxiliary subunit
MGVDVPAVAVALQQAQALKAFQTAESNVKGRVAAIRLRERELAVQESFLGDKLKLSMRVSELERENATLKSKVRTLETPQPGTYVPGQGVSPR